jgi:dUTP pyrophosphatase
MRGTIGAGFYDIFTTSEIAHKPYNPEVITLHTGLSIEVPKGFVLVMTLRSSLAKAGFVIPNSPAIIDSDYRGEIKIMITTVTHVNSFSCKPGDRIAQCNVLRAFDIEWSQVEDLTITDRGGGGFGSTGR